MATAERKRIALAARGQRGDSDHVPEAIVDVRMRQGLPLIGVPYKAVRIEVGLLIRVIVNVLDHDAHNAVDGQRGVWQVDVDLVWVHDIDGCCWRRRELGVLLTGHLREDVLNVVPGRRDGLVRACF